MSSEGDLRHSTMSEQPELVDRDRDEVVPNPKSSSSSCQDRSGDATTTSVVKPTTSPSPTVPKRALNASPTPEQSNEPVVDIEHVPVEDDPRKWSLLRKNVSLGLISMGSMIAGLAASIQNPAVKEMEVDLPATSAQFSWSISTFILVQGLFPLIWTAVSEIKGRRLVYLISLSLFMIGSIVVALSKNIGLVIGFRVFQAAGSSAVIAIGAATLADIFEPAERGTKARPALGPIFGGVLTTGFSWRAIFWFLTVISGIILLAFFVLFKDTFRKERSLIYQSVLKSRMAAAAAEGSSGTAAAPISSSKDNTEKTAKANVTVSEKDVEKAVGAQVVTPVAEIKLSLMDVNPIRPIGLVLRRLNNFVVLFASGLFFAYGLMIPYVSARTLSTYYGFEALKIGLVTLSYGFGSLAGSLLGGRWSDRQLAKLKGKNGGLSKPEMRLYSTVVGVCLLPPLTVALGWIFNQHVHVSAICVFLFLCGFCSIWIYSSTLAYIVDANVGRSSTAVATNSAFRGVFAFVATEIAVPMQDGLGDGWTYTILAGIMALSGSLILLVAWKGDEWREKGEASENKTTTA